MFQLMQSSSFQGNVVVRRIWAQKQVESEGLSQTGFVSQFETIVFKSCSWCLPWLLSSSLRSCAKLPHCSWSCNAFGLIFVCLFICRSLSVEQPPAVTCNYRRERDGSSKKNKSLLFLTQHLPLSFLL